MKRPIPKGELLLLAITVLVAVLFRTYRLDAVPRGMSGDEGVRGLDALSIVRGEGYPLFFQQNSGEEPMHAYVVAILLSLLGPSVLAIRAASALIGVLTVPIFYLMTRALLPPPAGSWSRLAILATGWLATSYWHVVYSRWGLEPILVPLFAVLTVYFLWQGFNSGRRLHFACAGSSLGLSLYTYQAARFLPVLVLVLVGYHALNKRALLRSQWTGLVSLLLAFLIVAAPLGAYALNHSEVFLARGRAVSIFNPDRTVSPWTSLLFGLIKTAGMYNFHGDEHPEHSPSAGRPVLDPLTSVCFALGLAVTIYRFRKPAYFLLSDHWRPSHGVHLSGNWCAGELDMVAGQIELGPTLTDPGLLPGIRSHSLRSCYHLPGLFCGLGHAGGTALRI
jgi:4-amino-4-deoxy-L-arabinose transferase-like glycosyltransferase